jgi:rhamnose transport system substrate-binding protein
VQQGARASATALGDHLAVQNADGTAQIGAIKSLIAQHVSAIAVDPDDAAAVKPALAQAHAAGIPTLSVEQAVPGSGSVWVNQSGAAQYAQALAHALALQMGRKGQYAIVGQQDQFPIANQWQKLIKSYVARKYPRMKLIRVIRGTGAGDEIEVSAVKRFMAAHPRLRGLVGVTPTEGNMVAKAIIQAHKIGKVFAAGNGGGCPPVDPLQRSFVRRGAEQIVCAGDPVKLGYLTVWAANYLATGHTFAAGRYNVGGPVGTVQYISHNEELRLGKPVTITKTNLGQYSG